MVFHLQFVSIYAAYLYDSVKLYARALHKLLSEQSLLTDEVIEEVASNGTKIVETIIKLKTYKSKFMAFICVFPTDNLINKCEIRFSYKIDTYFIIKCYFFITKGEVMRFSLKWS